MINMQQAIHAQEFHAGECVKTIGKRGGVKITQEIWRRNGKTKLWKTRPTEYSIPVKHGLYRYDYITQEIAHKVHTWEDCPINGIAITDARPEWLYGTQMEV